MAHATVHPSSSPLQPTRRALLARAALAAPALALPPVALAAEETDPHPALLAEARRLWRIDSGSGEDVAGDLASELEDRVIDTPARTLAGLRAQVALLLDYAATGPDDDTPQARVARAVAAGIERLFGEARHA